MVEAISCCAVCLKNFQTPDCSVDAKALIKLGYIIYSSKFQQIDVQHLKQTKVYEGLFQAIHYTSYVLIVSASAITIFRGESWLRIFFLEQKVEMLVILLF